MARTAVRALLGEAGRRCEQMGGRNKREGEERRVVVGVPLPTDVEECDREGEGGRGRAGEVSA
ncbi:hypothetical protein CRG98_006931 [Punica granatum]|uniref:Uncharacterized protein n=1 Tax=Punica granatum TaxID=22663 RepID=A0A2I0KWF9_PUNGR|nr:hypothetical protein CRG98_006931 [Punica granatum]